MPVTPRQHSGRQAEQQALIFLEKQGFRLLAQNWLCKGGELDLVMLDGDTVVFVEVRYRLHANWGGALGSIDRRKQARLTHAAQTFLQKEARWSGHPCRFDVIALEGTSGGAAPLNWVRNAFDS